MQIVFRVDASQSIGTGHVYRCLTLARELKNKGGVCTFVCAEHEGHMAEILRDLGHSVHLLPRPFGSESRPVQADELSHAGWLACTQADDARMSLHSLQAAGLAMPDWWVVDHYGLDHRWERAVRGHARILVIDDLADRLHDCDVLTDPGLQRCPADYAKRVPAPARLYLGPAYALLREEFALNRQASLERRATACLRRLLVFMGGMDPQGATAHVLGTLLSMRLPAEMQVDVVMGAQASTLDAVQTLMQTAPAHWRLLTHVSDMAGLMVQADLAIGACGTTVWERACLGLPSVCAVLADNQEGVGEALASARLAWVVRGVAGLDQPLRSLLQQAMQHPEELARMSRHSARTTEGLGASLLVDVMLASHTERIQT